MKPIKWLDNRLPWKVWLVLLILLSIGYYLARLSVPEYPYHYDGNVFYPWLIFYNSIAFHITALAVGILLGLCLFYSLKANKKGSVGSFVEAARYEGRGKLEFRGKK